MKKVFNLKNVLLLLAVVILSGSLVIFLTLKKKSQVNKYENDYYTFIYDRNWKVKTAKKDNVVLDNKKDAILNINIIELDSEQRYLSIDQLIDSVVYDIEKQNTDYKLISKKNTNVTKNNLDGYKYLYENKDNEVMLVVTKYSNKLLVFSYEATSKNFDIVLDSVESIIYNFNFKKEKYELSNKISVETKSLTYSSNDKLTKKISKTNNYDIASNHSLVNYSIPDIFEPISIATNLGYFTYSNDSDNISLSVNIYNQNIYDYLDKDKKSGSIYSDFSDITEDDEKYSNISKNLSEITKGNYKGYIYQVKYTIKSEDFITKKDVMKDYEIYYIVFALDKNHILLMELKGSNVKIPQDIIDNININSFKHYASNINRVIEDNHFKLLLQQKADYSSKVVNKIVVNVPEKYRERDLNLNMYETRLLGLNYDNNNSTYQYEIKYRLSTGDNYDSQISLVNSSYSLYSENDRFQPLEYKEDITLNNKIFSLYEGGYVKRDALYGSDNRYDTYHVNVKTLLYKIESKGTLVITISGNNAEIDNGMLEDLTNFEVTSK